MGLVTAAFAAFFAAVRIPFILAHPKGLRWGAAMASVTGLLLFLTMFFGFHMPAAGAAAMGLAGHSLWNLLADALRPAAVVNREYLDMAVRLGRRDPESAAEIFEKILGPVDRLDMNSLDGKVSAKPGPLDPSLLDPAETRIVVLNALSVNTPEDLERVVKAMARPGVVFTSDEQSVVDLVASKLTDHPGAEAKLAGDRLFENGSLHLDALNRVLPSGAETVEVVAPKDSGPVIREDDTDPRLSRAEVKSLESLLRLIEYLGILNAFIERQA
jgi:hypothetical protein